MSTDSLTPTDLTARLLAAGGTRAGLGVADMLVRGALSGALLGVSTSLAVTAAAQTAIPLIGALIFPVGFIMIVLLGFELVTGNFAILPLAVLGRRLSPGAMLANFVAVFVGNLIGSLIYAALFAVVMTDAGTAGALPPVAATIVHIAQVKTTGYAAMGAAGLATCFVKAILCNWMVCMGVVMGLASTSQIGRIVGAWMPIMIFFAQGFEHSVVNMFVIPAGMMLGARITLADWWLWNEIPVTLGNLAGGVLLVALPFFLTYVRGAPARPVLAEPAAAGAD